jgi:sterol desaturase/sphingolipid hydroxylase (fatty acid hydroxylase superfamily)
MEQKRLEHPDSRLSFNPLALGKLPTALLWLTLLAVALVLAITPLGHMPWLYETLLPIGAHVLPQQAVYSPLVYLLLLTLVFWLENRYPVRDQAIISTAFLQDAIWYGVRATFRIVLISTYFLFLTAFYQQHLSFLTVAAVAEWHPALRAVVAILIVDFMRWFGHFVKHKVHVFWLFHSVHHSQRELNLFTDARAHPVDQMVSRTIRFIPLLMFQNAFPIIIAWVIVESAYAKLYHSNVRLNMGPLRYVLVTPQSHRIHHSCAWEHHDRNFGFMFCVWDRLFGTHYEGGDEYPETGVPDPAFPHEQRGDGIGQMAANVIRQLVYPFKAMFSSTRARTAFSAEET